jgi:hypothetical protein
MSSVISRATAVDPDRAVLGAVKLLCDKLAKPGQDCAWLGVRGHQSVLYVRVVCRGRLEWSAPDRSTEDGKAYGLEGFYSPRAGIHSAAEAADLPFP